MQAAEGTDAPVIAFSPSVTVIEAFLRDGDLLDLGARAAAARASTRAGYREDGAVRMADRSSEWTPGEAPEGPARKASARPRELHVLAPDEARLRELRRLHPDLWIHAAVPAGLDRDGALGLAAAGADSLLVATGSADAGEGSWAALLDLPLPVVASATYGPASSPEAVAARLDLLRRGAGLRCVVWLPDHPGDQVFVPGRTTDGTEDAILLAATRLALPRTVRVRASWAAYGWKMAQFALTFGIDEVAGWGLEEEAAWPGQASAAAVVTREEAEAGLVEAGREPVEVHGCAWES